MSSFFGINSSSYYKWTKDSVGFWQQQNSRLLAKLKEVYSMSKGRYGSPCITEELNAEGIKVSRPPIARLMSKSGIRSIMKRKYRVTTNSNHLSRKCKPAFAGLQHQDYRGEMGKRYYLYQNWGGLALSNGNHGPGRPENHRLEHG